MDFIKKEDITVLKADFQESHQLLWDENSGSQRVNLTKVYVYPGQTNPRHIHKTSEQIWVALHGTATLLLANDETKEFSEGDVVRFADGDTHGVTNNMEEAFVYLSVTSPPLNFRFAYNKENP